MIPDAYRIHIEADAFNDRIRGVLARFVRYVFVIAVVTATFTMFLRWMGVKAALDMAQAFVRYASFIGDMPGASSQAALCLCPETMRAFAREGERSPYGTDWHTTEENPEILFRSLQGVPIWRRCGVPCRFSRRIGQRGARTSPLRFRMLKIE